MRCGSPGPDLRWSGPCALNVNDGNHDEDNSLDIALMLCWGVVSGVQGVISCAGALF